MDVPDAIRNLRLCSAFKGHAVDVMDCVDSRNDMQLRVVDDNAVCVSRFAGADETADCFSWITLRDVLFICWQSTTNC